MKLRLYSHLPATLFSIRVIGLHQEFIIFIRRYIILAKVPAVQACVASVQHKPFTYEIYRAASVLGRYRVAAPGVYRSQSRRA